MDPIQIIEIIAATIGILYVVLEMKASMWLWPVGIVLPLFYMYISWVSGIYGNIAVNIYYLLACIWGWWMWKRRAAKGKAEDRILRAGSRTMAILAGITVVGAIVVRALFVRYTDNPQPTWDAVATMLSMVGMWLLGKKYIENWYCWISSNAIYCFIFLAQKYYITGAFYVVYTIVAVMGLIMWRRMMEKESERETKPL